MEQETAIDAISHAIQLSVAPVFLLSAISGMLAVMINRLGRIVDSARAVEARLPDATSGELESSHARLKALARRAKFINRAITLCTITALLVCSVVATLFVAAFLHVDATLLVAVLFVGAMLSFIAGLLCFLREIFIATASVRIGPR